MTKFLGKRFGWLARCGHAVMIAHPVAKSATRVGHPARMGHPAALRMTILIHTVPFLSDRVGVLR